MYLSNDTQTQDMMNKEEVFLSEAFWPSIFCTCT